MATDTNNDSTWSAVTSVDDVTAKRIVFINDDETIGIIIPADCGLTIEEIAEKDVPSGLTYHIVDKSEIPTDRTFRDAWKWQ